MNLRGLQVEIRKASQRLRELARSLADNQILLSEFSASFVAEIRDIHALAVAAADPDAADHVGSLVVAERCLADQLVYTDSLLLDVQSHSQPLDGTFVRRCGMYASAARATYWSVRRHLATEHHGHRYERRVLGKAEHCGECVELAGRGWQPIGTLPMVGETQCLSNCRCRFAYRKTAPGVEVEFSDSPETFTAVPPSPHAAAVIRTICGERPTPAAPVDFHKPDFHVS